jgi:hypothetical protein
MVVKHKGKLLKNKEVDGELLKNEEEGELLKDKVIEGDPLWKDKDRLDEKKYKEKNLNEDSKIEKIKVLFCNCGWQSEPDIGMKNECPDCRKSLSFVAGTKEEVEEYFVKRI